MIRDVTYYQAQCDRCGSVDDGGDFSAWGEAEFARMAALNGGWAEIDVRVANGARGSNIHAVTPLSGDSTHLIRSILLCTSCQGDGVDWCAQCEADLEGTKWAITSRHQRAIENTCPDGHRNTISFARNATFDRHPVGTDSHG